MAHRMQRSVPELTDIRGEAQSVLSLYGPDVTKKGTFAHSCLLARRLAERGVPFTQIFIRGWDQHGNLTGDLPNACRDVDQPCYGLLTDLEQRGMLDDTLVVWGGEFGRTTYCQGALSKTNYGRDHHPRCFSIWMAGGGIKGGVTHGETDDFSYNILDESKAVSAHDLNATILHLLGIDHERLTYRFQGRDFRLTDVHGNVVHELIA
jgi:arylsulfatase A-like enzyme